MREVICAETVDAAGDDADKGCFLVGKVMPTVVLTSPDPAVDRDTIGKAFIVDWVDG